MQKLLSWEIESDNPTTRTTASYRDISSMEIIAYFNQEFANSDIDINVSSSLLIGGIYYLILHRERGTINLLDFTKNSEIEKLVDTINKILIKLYTPDNYQSIEIAKRLFNNDVSYDVVKYSTQLPDSILTQIQYKN